jgi:hypothetical protein
VWHALHFITFNKTRLAMCNFENAKKKKKKKKKKNPFNAKPRSEECIGTEVSHVKCG